MQFPLACRKGERRWVARRELSGLNPGVMDDYEPSALAGGDGCAWMGDGEAARRVPGPITHTLFPAHQPLLLSQARFSAGRKREMQVSQFSRGGARLSEWRGGWGEGDPISSSQPLLLLH